MMKAFKESFLKIVDKLGPWFIGIGGLALTAFCAWFQTVGFTYVTLSDCLTAGLVGLAAAVLITAYLYRQTKPNAEKPYNVMTPEQFARIMRGIAFMFVVVSVAAFLATSVPAFMVGLGAMAYGCGSMIVYLFCKALMKKRKTDGN